MKIKIRADVRTFWCAVMSSEIKMQRQVSIEKEIEPDETPESLVTYVKWSNGNISLDPNAPLIITTHKVELFNGYESGTDSIGCFRASCYDVHQEEDWSPSAVKALMEKIGYQRKSRYSSLYIPMTNETEEVIKEEVDLITGEVKKVRHLVEKTVDEKPKGISPTKEMIQRALELARADHIRTSGQYYRSIPAIINKMRNPVKEEF